MAGRFWFATCMAFFIGFFTLTMLGFAQERPQEHAQERTQASTKPMDFQGRYLVSISDADMLASAYVDNQLGPREGRDALSVIPLGSDSEEMRAHEVEVSNSVAGPPSAIAVSPDGKWAFVVESFKQAENNTKTFKELAVGNQLIAVELSDPQKPRIHARIEIGTRPETVEISPRGDMLVVTLHPRDGRQLAFVPWRNNQFGKPTYTTLPNVTKDVRVSHAVWHPSGNYIASTLVDRAQVVFARVRRNSDAITLEPWGAPTIVGKYPFKIMFTSDGQHLLTTNLKWGPDVQGFWTEAPRGSIGVVRFSMQPEKNGQPRHPLVSVAETGVSPEGITISPDGTLVVTANLERSYLPYNDSRITWFSSLTLMRFDPKKGLLETLGDYFHDGILPETLTFDTSGRYIAVSTYDHFDDSHKGGSIDFWRVASDPMAPKPRLVKTNYSVTVTRGVHSMVLVR